MLAEFDKFEVVRLLDAGQNGWSRVQASLYDAESFEEKGVTGFVRSDQLTLLADDPVPEELFSRNFTYTRQGSDLRSSLELNRDADGATFDYAIYSKNRKTAASRMIDFSEGRLTYIDGHLGAYLSQPTIYDSSRHLLYLAGMLWHAE